MSDSPFIDLGKHGHLAASEHEVLPHEDTEFYRYIRDERDGKGEELTIADFIEIICLVDTSTPNSNHILVSIYEQLEPGAVPVPRHPEEE